MGSKQVLDLVITRVEGDHSNASSESAFRRKIIKTGIMNYSFFKKS